MAIDGVPFAEIVIVRRDRASGFHYCPHWLSGLWLTMGILALLFAGACRHTAPVDRRPEPPAARRTIVAPATTPATPPARVSRPRGPAYRIDNGLGSPIARLRQGYAEAGSDRPNSDL